MEKNTVFEGGMGELGLGIEGVLRRAARSLIAQAHRDRSGRIAGRVFCCADGQWSSGGWLYGMVTCRSERS